MDKKRLFLSLTAVILAIIVLISTLALDGLDRSHAASPSHGSAAQHAQQPIQFKAFNTPEVQNNVYYGADRNSVYAYTAKTGTLLWRYKKSASVQFAYFMTVSGGSVFLDLWGFANSSDSVVVALNASTGALRWTSSSLGYGPPGGSTYVANGILYYLQPGPFNYGYLFAMSMSKGTILWSTAANTVYSDGLGMFYISALGTQGEPLQWACAVNAATGAQLWCYQHAFLVGMGQGVLYATVYDWNNPSAAAVVALRASDGSLLWSYNGPTVATFAGDAVYVLTNTSTTQSAALCALSPSAGTSLWCDSAVQYTYGSPITVVNGVVYVPGSPLQAFRASDGTLLWTENAGLLFVNQGVAYLLGWSSTGNTTLIAHPDHAPTVFWQRSLGIGNTAVCHFPVSSALYCSSADGHVLSAFNAPNGSLLWRHGFEGTFSWIGVTNGIVYATTSITMNGQSMIGNHAFNANTGTELWRF